MARSKIDKGVTLVAANSIVKGDIEFSDQVFVNGKIVGNLVAEKDSSATVIIAEEGHVAGEIRVPNVTVHGQVEGNVFASECLELAAKARVKGNVYYKLIEMQLGAMVAGQLVHHEDPNSQRDNVHPFRADEKTNKPHNKPQNNS